MDNKKVKKWIKCLYTAKKFLFDCNSNTDKNPNFAYDINNFW